MEILDIIKEAFVFPSQNLDKLAIYIVLTFITGLLAAGSVISVVYSILDSSAVAAVGVILFILSLIVGFIITGYQISILKSGIEFEDEAPSFDWKNDLVTGIKMFVVSIVYFIIPVVVVGIVALATNLPGQFMDIVAMVNDSANATALANTTNPVISSIPQNAMAAFTTSIALTAIVGAILFIIFAFIQTMGESRLANTGRLGDALNIVEAFKDIGRIGYGKVIAVVILVLVVTAVVTGILGYIYGQIPQLSILSIIVTPYLAFFTQRAIGLLYSDIA